jgi:hypothetical protein
VRGQWCFLRCRTARQSVHCCYFFCTTLTQCRLESTLASCGSNLNKLFPLQHTQPLLPLQIDLVQVKLFSIFAKHRYTAFYCNQAIPCKSDHGVFNPNSRPYCLSPLGCRPSSRPTSFSAENASVRSFRSSAKDTECNGNEIKTFILSISSFSALVNLASICAHIVNQRPNAQLVNPPALPPLFLLQQLVRAFRVRTGTRIRPVETQFRLFEIVFFSDLGPFLNAPGFISVSDARKPRIKNIKAKHQAFHPRRRNGRTLLADSSA